MFFVYVNIKTYIEYGEIQKDLEAIKESYEKLENELKIKQQQLNILQDSVEKGRNEDN